MVSALEWIWYRLALKDPEFLKYLELNDSNYARFNFWFRTTSINTELGKLYLKYNLL